jgi:hypothetical protein
MVAQVYTTLLGRQYEREYPVTYSELGTILSNASVVTSSALAATLANYAQAALAFNELEFTTDLAAECIESAREIAGTGGVSEIVTITAVTAFQLTATFAQSHSGAYTITPANATLGPTGGQLLGVAPIAPATVLRPFDVLTLTRVSNASGTGVATPAGLVEIEWVPAEAQG